MNDTLYPMTCPVCGRQPEEVDHREDRAIVGPNLTEEVTDSYYFLCPGCGSEIRVRRKKQ